MSDIQSDRPHAEPITQKDAWPRILLSAVLLWLPVTLVSGNMVLGLAGVCVGQMRKWTADELIEVAVRERAKARYQYEGRSWREMAIEDSESSIQTFLRDNPQCCDVTRIGGPLELLAGWSAAEVELNYERNPDRPLSRRNRYYKKVVVVNSCGEVLGTTRGIDSETLETTNHIRK